MPIQLKTHAILIFLAVVVLGVYANSLSNAFVWDDEEQIVNNQVIRNINNLPQILTSGTFTTGGGGLSGGFYRPLVSLWNLVHLQLWGLTPWTFRAFQIVFHIANVFLVFFIARKLLSSHDKAFGQVTAFLTSLIFAVHPANVEAVAYIASVGEVLYAFFILGAFLVLLQGADLQTASIRRKFIYASIILGFLGMLAKENAIVIFPISALYIFLFLRPKDSGFIFSLKNFIVYIIGAAGAVGAYLFLRLAVAGIAFGQSHISPIAKADFLTRLFTIPYEIFTYFEILFFPARLFIYRHFLIFSASDIRFWGVLMVLALIGVFMFWLIKINKKSVGSLLIFGLAWLFVGIAPVLNIIPLDMTVAERWLYFPMIGAWLFASMAGARLVWNAPFRARAAALAIFIVFVLAFSARAVLRNQDWQDGLSLYGHDIKYSLDNANLENNYGVELFRAGKIEEGRQHLQRSVELEENWAISRNNLGAALEKRGNLEEARQEYEKALAISDYYLAYENLAGLLLRLGQTEEAKIFMENALKKLPYNTKLNMALVIVYSQEGRKGDAIALLERVLRADPRNVQAQKFYLLIQSGQKIQ